MYANEIGTLKEGKRCQVSTQIKDHHWNYYLSVGWRDPTEQRNYVGMQQETKNHSLDGLCNMMCFLMTKWGVLRGESLFWCALSDFLGFIKTDEEPHPINFVGMAI